MDMIVLATKSERNKKGEHPEVVTAKGQSAAGPSLREPRRSTR